jgi:RNA polymerase sigma-70 factor, ECF subfamily
VLLERIEAVYRSRAADFYRVALATTGDPQSAQDAVQEGFARAIRSRTSFRASGSLEAWICRCVVNAAHDQQRRASVQRALIDELRDPALIEMPNESVREAILELPQRQRDALFLRYYLDFDYADIADALGVQIGTVSATLHAAHAALSNVLTEVG